MKTLYIIIVSALLFASCQREDITVKVSFNCWPKDQLKPYSIKCKVWKTRFKSEEIEFTNNNAIPTFEVDSKEGKSFYYKIECQDTSVSLAIIVTRINVEGWVRSGKQSVTLTGRY